MNDFDIDVLPRKRTNANLGELRRLYNNSLPPSLRWGTTGRSADEQDIAGPISKKKYRRRSFDRSPMRYEPLPPRGPPGPSSRIPPPPPRSDEYEFRRDKPIYPGIRKNDVLIDTLTWYDVPWEYDKDDTNYIVVLRDLDRYEENVLYDHTKRLRDGGAVDEPWAASNRRFGQRRRSSDVLSIEDSNFSEGTVPLKFSADLKAADVQIDADDEHDDSGTEGRSEPEISTNIDMKIPVQSVVYSTFGEGDDVFSSSSDMAPRLEVVPSRGSERLDPLFHLLHIHQDQLNFDNLLETVLSIPQLHEVKDKIKEHFDHAWSPVISSPWWLERNRYCKHWSTVHTDECQRTKDGKEHEIPGADWYDANDAEIHFTRNRKFMVTSAKVPFAYLGGIDSTTKSTNIFGRKVRDLAQNIIDWRAGSLHGSQATTDQASLTHMLFQSLNRNSDNKSDLKQVACHVLPGVDRKCLFTTQLWVLIINNEFLITCSVLPQEGIYGKLLSTPADNVLDLHQDRVDVRLRASDGSVWLLKRNECRTYFEFISQLPRARDVIKEFAIHHGEQEISASDWVKFMEHNKDSVLHLTLDSTTDMKYDKHLGDLTSHKRQEHWATERARNLRNALEKKAFRRSTVTEADNDISARLWTAADLFKIAEANLTLETNEYDRRPSQEVRDNSKGDTNDSTTLEAHKYGHMVLAFSFDRIYEECLALDPRDFDHQLHSWYRNNQTTLKDAEDLPMPDARDSEGDSMTEGDLSTSSLNTGGFNDNDTIEIRLNDRVLKPDPPEDGKGNHDDERFLPARVVDRVSLVFGVGFPYAPRTDGAMFADIINGLRSLLVLFPTPCPVQMQPAQAKLLGAVVDFVSSLGRLCVLQSPNPTVLFLRKTCEHNGTLKSLFNFAAELEMYPFDFGMMPNDNPASLKALHTFTRHCVAALVLAASLAQILVENYEYFEQEIGRHPAAKIPKFKNGLNACLDILMDYGKDLDRSGTVDEVGKVIFSTGIPSATSRLQELDLTEDAAHLMIQFEHGWTRVHKHADEANRYLESAFTQCLTSRRTKTFSKRATVDPHDLLTLLLQRVLHLPVLGRQDAMHMYNKYMTELESDFMTDDSTSKTSERLRYLKHELNAFAQLQHKQIEVLEGLTQYAERRDDLHLTTFAGHHPGSDQLEETLNKLKLQNENVHALDRLIDKLQRQPMSEVSVTRSRYDSAIPLLAFIAVGFILICTVPNFTFVFN